MATSPRFAQRVFATAGIYGILVLAPMYFLEERIGRDTPPAITHPEHFYGFIGTALVFQLVFLVIARDPQRYRALMPVAVLEKLAFGLPVWLLFAQGRVASSVVAAGSIDLLLGVFFVLAYFKTSST